MRNRIRPDLHVVWVLSRPSSGLRRVMGMRLLRVRLGGMTVAGPIALAIFAFLAAGAFKSVEEAQQRMCLPHLRFEPQASSRGTYDELFAHYRKLYFAFGQSQAEPAAMGDVLPALRAIAARARKS